MIKERSRTHFSRLLSLIHKTKSTGLTLDSHILTLVEDNPPDRFDRVNRAMEDDHSRTVSRPKRSIFGIALTIGKCLLGLKSSYDKLRMWEDIKRNSDLATSTYHDVTQLHSEISANRDQLVLLTDLLNNQNHKISNMESLIIGTTDSLRILIHADHLVELLFKLEFSIKSSLDILLDILSQQSNQIMSRFLVPPEALRSALLSTMSMDPLTRFPFPISNVEKFYTLHTAETIESEDNELMYFVWNIPISYLQHFYITKLHNNKLLAISERNDIILLDSLELANHCIKPSSSSIVCESRFCILNGPAFCDYTKVPNTCGNEFLLSHSCTKVDQETFEVSIPKALKVKISCPQSNEIKLLQPNSIIKVDKLCRMDSEALSIPNNLIGFDRVILSSNEKLDLDTIEFEIFNLSRPTLSAVGGPVTEILMKNKNMVNITRNRNLAMKNNVMSLSGIILACSALAIIFIGAIYIWYVLRPKVVLEDDSNEAKDEHNHVGTETTEDPKFKI